MKLDTDTIRSYLPAYGYKPNEDDTIMIRHALERAIHRALSFTNQKKIPRGLEMEIINMAVGEFLYLKKITGQLTSTSSDDNGGYNFAAHVRQFTEGDTNVSINDKGRNEEANFEAWIDQLRHGDPFVLEHFRRLHW